MPGVAGEHHAEQVVQRERQFRLGQLIAGAPPLRNRYHQPAPPQVGQMVRQLGPRHTECLGQLGGVGRPITQ